MRPYPKPSGTTMHATGGTSPQAFLEEAVLEGPTTVPNTAWTGTERLGATRLIAGSNVARPARLARHTRPTAHLGRRLSKADKSGS